MIETEINVPDSLGLTETLRQMRLMEIESLENSYFQHLCDRTFGHPDEITPQDLYKAVFDFVSKFKYEDDPEDEKLTAPKYLFTTHAGDCDDFALFIKTVLKYYGIDAKYLLCGKTDEGFSHIVVETPEGIILDGTNDKYNFLSDEYKFKLRI
jgi:hypothetical protein